ncbi:unnamed protein product [Meloidogyne enterolobii]|uniref:Uncharacterized protein n=1 Tax=Meloidogyne enterolobii TaxID=390850 RepID=A0ACB0ZYD0_MELEN
MYLNIKLLLIFLLKILLFFCKAESFTEQITCVNDYLLISKNLETKIYAKKIGKEWNVERGISKNIISKKIEKDFKIEKEEMSHFMGEEFADRCFELNEKLVKQGDIFSFKDFLKKFKKENSENFILSTNIQDELGK